MKVEFDLSEGLPKVSLDGNPPVRPLYNESVVLESTFGYNVFCDIQSKEMTAKENFDRALSYLSQAELPD